MGVIQSTIRRRLTALHALPDRDASQERELIDLLRLLLLFDPDAPPDGVDNSPDATSTPTRH